MKIEAGARLDKPTGGRVLIVRNRSAAKAVNEATARYAKSILAAKSARRNPPRARRAAIRQALSEEAGP